VVGEDGKKALKANLADRMMGETKRNAKQVFTPSILDKTIKQFGDARLKAIYTPEEYNALKELSKLTSAKKVADIEATYEAERKAAADKAEEERKARDEIELAALKAKNSAEEAAQTRLRKYNRVKAEADKALALAQAKADRQKALSSLGFLADIFAGKKKGEINAAYDEIEAAINSIPLPAAAMGGVVMPRDGGQVVNVAEAGVPEAILPLDRLDEVLASMGDRPEAGGGMTHLTVNLDSKALLDTIYKATKDGRVLISARSIV